MLPRTTILAKNIAAVIMMAALLLLVTGNYWVYGFPREKQAVTAAADEEESGNTVPAPPNPTEEKTANGLSGISEYLQDHSHCIHQPVAIISSGFAHEFDQLPVHHPERQTPPPKRA